MTETVERRGPLGTVRNWLRLAYHGRTPWALRFQASVLVVDLAIIGFFIISPLVRDERYFLWVDAAIALLLAVDLIARGLASTDIPRLWTLTRTGALTEPLRRLGREDREDAVRAVINLLTFLFVVTGFIYAVFAQQGSGIESYVDALYFTVTTITTTGFGDITLPGTGGKLASIVIMIVGISLFVRLAQSVFRPHKVTYPCERCGLNKHDPDAVHCKACGHLLKIPDEGL